MHRTAKGQCLWMRGESKTSSQLHASHDPQRIFVKRFRGMAQLAFLQIFLASKEINQSFFQRAIKHGIDREVSALASRLQWEKRVCMHAETSVTGIGVDFFSRECDIVSLARLGGPFDDAKGLPNGIGAASGLQMLQEFLHGHAIDFNIVVMDWMPQQSVSNATTHQIGLGWLLDGGHQCRQLIR